MADEPSTEQRGFVRRIVRWLVRRFYPNLRITGAERIPQTGPVLLCGNHANSMLDPVLIGIAARRPVRFLAKAPLFETPILGPIMSTLGMVPAFRGSDNPREVRRNVESLDVGAKVLVNGSAMGIFPEGKSTDHAHLEMVRSGAARMALQAVEDGATDLKVIPIGLTYECKEAFRSGAWIEVGRPIDAASMLAEHDGDVRKARRALTEQLTENLRDVVVHLDDPDWQPWLEDLETLAQPPRESTHKPVDPLVLRKRIADAMNYFMQHDRERAESVGDDIKVYRANVAAAGLTVDSPVLRMHGLRVGLRLVWEFLLLILLLVPALFGTLHHLFPFVTVRLLANTFNQAGRQTMSTSLMFVGVPIYAAWYVAVGWWMLGYYADWFAWAWLAAMPFCGVIALFYWRRAGDTTALLWHQLKAIVRRDKLLGLRKEETAIRGQLKDLAEDYERQDPRPEPEVRVLRRKLVARVASWAMFAAVIGIGLWVLAYWVFDKPLTEGGLDLASMSELRTRILLAGDERTMTAIIDGIDQLEDEAVKLQAEFFNAQRSFTNQGDNDDVRELMRRYLAYRESLLRILWKYQRYAEIDDERLRLRAFLLEFTAASTLYQASLKFVHVFGDQSAAVAKLDEPEPNWGIPPGLYSLIRRNLASRRNINMYEFARRFYRQPHIQEQFKSYQLAEDEPYDGFHQAIANADKTIRLIDDSLPQRIVEVAIADMGRLLKKVQYETQSAVSTWIGDFKIRQPRNGDSLINAEQLAKLAKELQPGDVLLERRNWYLSNAFLPGYWPHGAVYVGTADNLRKRGLDKNEHVARHWDKFISKDEHGHEHVIIEAISEGVVFSSLEHSIGGADSVAVLRPRVSEDEKNKAIARAFSFAGRPYDFEFDFASTDMLVCTEVVFRSYGGNSGLIQFPLEQIMGRTTMPAINLVRKYVDEAAYDAANGTDDAQFEFVALVQGDELAGTSAFHTDAAAFSATLDLPASSFLQRSDPYSLKSIGLLGWILLGLTVVAAAMLACQIVHRAAKTGAGS